MKSTLREEAAQWKVNIILLFNISSVVQPENTQEWSCNNNNNMNTRLIFVTICLLELQNGEVDLSAKLCVDVTFSYLVSSVLGCGC